MAAVAANASLSEQPGASCNDGLAAWNRARGDAVAALAGTASKDASTKPEDAADKLSAATGEKLQAVTAAFASETISDKTKADIVGTYDQAKLQNARFKSAVVTFTTDRQTAFDDVKLALASSIADLEPKIQALRVEVEAARHSAKNDAAVVIDLGASDGGFVKKTADAEAAGGDPDAGVENAQQVFADSGLR